MAITAVAAIAGAGAVGAGIATAAVVGYVAVAVTVVGFVTKSETLMKIGGGLGVGAGAAGLMGAGEAGAASSAASSTTTAGDMAASANLSDAQVAGNTVTQAGGAPGAGAATSANLGDAQLAGNNAAQVSAASQSVAPTVAGQMAQPVASASGAAPLGNVGTSGSSLVDAAKQTTMATGSDALNQTVAKTAATGSSTLQSGSSFFDNLLKAANTPNGALAIGQRASGLISGVGTGASNYLAADKRQKWEQSQLDYRRNNLNSQPTISYNSELTKARTT